MTRSLTPQINGLRLSFVDRRLHVDYEYPGTIDVDIIGGVRLKAAKDAGTFELGRFDHADGAWFDELRWTWDTARATTRARVWVQNVLVAHEEQVSRSYEHDGELVVIWHRLPTRNSEQALLAAGFEPSLATWRAAPTDRRRAVARTLLTNEAATPGAFAREQTSDTDELRQRAQHAWMRWFAVFRDTLAVGGRTYKIAGRPALRGDALVLDLRHGSGVSLYVRLDVSKHPLLYPVSVDGDVTLQRDSLAWEDFPALAEEIGGILDARRKQQAASKPSGKKGSSPRKKPLAPMRPRELEALPSATPVAPTWADRFVDAFNESAGPQLVFSRHRGAHTSVFVIHAEERPDRPLAVVDTRDERIIEIRWLDESVPPAQRTALGERLERALAVVQPELADALSHAAIEKLKARAIELGADPERTMRGAGGDEYRWLAETLRDLAEPRGMSQDDLADWLSVNSLRAAAHRVRKHSDEQALVDFLGELWDQIAESVVLHPVDRVGDQFAVHPRTIHESDQGFVLVLREADAEGRPRVVSVNLREDCEEDRCIVDSDELVGGERSWHLGREWDYRFIHDLYHNIRSFEQGVRAAPARLADVREMLFWTAAMIDTPRCRGESRRTVEAAFREAKEHYDRARVLVAQGDSIEGLRAIHAALVKIAAAAAELASSCGTGQASLPGTPVQLRVEMRAPRVSRLQARRRAIRQGPPRVTASVTPPDQPPRRRAEPKQYEEREFYIYKGGSFCEACGEAIRRQRRAQGLAPANPHDENTYDSEEFPKGPYVSDAAEAPAHCGFGRDCLNAEEIETKDGLMRVGAFLGNPLTDRGEEYVRERVAGEQPVAIQIWGPYYDLPGVTRHHVGQALATLPPGGHEALQEWAASEDPSTALLDFVDDQIREGAITTTGAAAVLEALRLIASEDRLPLNPGGDVEAEDQLVLDAFHVRGFVPELVPHLPWGFELVLYTEGTNQRAAVIDIIDRDTIEFHWYDPAMPHETRRKIKEKIDRVLRMATEDSEPRASRKAPRKKPPRMESAGPRGAVMLSASPLAPTPGPAVRAAAHGGRGADEGVPALHAPVALSGSPSDVHEVLRRAGIDVGSKAIRRVGRIGEVQLEDVRQLVAAKSALDRAGIHSLIRGKRLHYVSPASEGGAS
ncbi:hypothetical protein [Nannocystis pusilla]|uniref:hypothetical protein n=1 Tax=Nannocystis pusilla TaxID=889268 RepID=UPI003BF0EFC2